MRSDSKCFDSKYIQKISYRPFDIQYIYSDKNFIERSRKKTMQHLINGKNIGLVVPRQCAGDWRYIFLTNNIIEFNLTGTAGKYGAGSLFPLYLYDFSEINLPRVHNLNMGIVNQISETLKLIFTPEKEETEGTFAPIDILDYLYAILHSPSYREKYKEFLKIDFPRVPYPNDKDIFWKLVEFGSELRQIHLLESPICNSFITSYPNQGTDEITSKIGKKDFEITDKENGIGRIWINEGQYFGDIPLVAWEFYIGGYQPAQKWLKDRRGMVLSDNDLNHYQKIIVALSETDRIMKEIDEVCCM